MNIKDKKQIKGNFIVLSLFLIIPLLIYWSTFMTQTILVSGDGILTLNWKNLLLDSIKNGEIPLWNRFVEVGTSYVGDIQNTFFYPLNLFGLFMDISTFNTFFYILHISLAGFFMYLYLNQIQDNKVVSFITGIIFMLSGILGGARREHINIISTIIWIPLILYLLERYIKTKKIGYILVSSVIMAVQFFAGFPQVALYSDILVFIYFLYLMISEKYTLKNIVNKISLWGVLYVCLISVQLIPLLQLTLFTGRADSSFEFFSIYSYDFKILGMMFFPHLYTNIFAPFEIEASSGFDIEIYIGIICLSYIIFFLPQIFKTKKYKFIFLVLVGVFIFGAGAHIPILGKILWKIPIIGSFRVISRVMGIFIILSLSLFAVSLSQLKKEDNWGKFIRFNVLYIITLIVVRLGIDLLRRLDLMGSIGTSLQPINTIKCWMPIIVLTIHLVVILICHKVKERKTNNNYIFYSVCISVCILTTYDVGQYSILYNHKKSINESIISSDSPEVAFLKEKDSELYRAFVAMSTPEDYASSGLKLGKLNHSMMSKNMVLNAFLTFNNPNISKTFGTAYYPYANEIIAKRNDIVSMLSIKYIFDPCGNIDSSSYTYGDEQEEVFKTEKLSIPESKDLNVQSYPIDLKVNTDYMIEFDMNTETIPEIFYMDFAAPGYDQAEQDMIFNIDVKENRYSIIVNTGDREIPKDVLFRIISQGNTDIEISNLKIKRLEKVSVEQNYKVNNDMNYIVYENQNAKPILYAPKQVVSINTDNALYEDPSCVQMDEINYIKNFKDMKLDNIDIQIDDIELKNNSVSAKVKASKAAFINHTQSMYPGWKAYVDGKQTPIYLVNGMIQGIEVPEGEHFVEFRYEPNDLLIGGIISSMGVLFVIGYFVWSKRNKKVNK